MSTPSDRKIQNEKDLSALRYRRQRIDDLIAVQTSSDCADLLKAEAFYVDETIRFRERHGGMTGFVMLPGAYVANAEIES
jgi:hypothetical protein